VVVRYKLYEVYVFMYEYIRNIHSLSDCAIYGRRLLFDGSERK